MPLDQISHAVLDLARTEADHVLKAAQLAADEKVRRAREAAEQDGERRYQAAARAVEEDYYRKLTQFSGAANKELLARKNACVRGIFQTARERIMALPEAEYLALMRRLLDRAGERHGGRLRVHADEKARFARLLAEFNAGRAAELLVALDEARALPEPGGFIFVSDTFEVDQTLGTLLSELEHEMAPQIAAELFGG
ncbi:MAG: hypothetical protein KA184_20055 [Candidatus Hydrogenedentes bacterium]|nr:hypothetical protein [Candidatus Hydrogenedentota bacterium]